MCTSCPLVRSLSFLYIFYILQISDTGIIFIFAFELYVSFFFSVNFPECKKHVLYIRLISVLCKCQCHSPSRTASYGKNEIRVGSTRKVACGSLKITASLLREYRSGGGVVDNTLDYQSRGRKIDPPFLRSFG